MATYVRIDGTEYRVRGDRDPDELRARVRELMTDGRFAVLDLHADEADQPDHLLIRWDQVVTAQVYRRPD